MQWQLPPKNLIDGATVDELRETASNLRARCHLNAPGRPGGGDDQRYAGGGEQPAIEADDN
jgi:hypothetical protein